MHDLIHAPLLSRFPDLATVSSDIGSRSFHRVKLLRFDGGQKSFSLACSYA